MIIKAINETFTLNYFFSFYMFVNTFIIVDILIYNIIKHMIIYFSYVFLQHKLILFNVTKRKNIQ